MNIHDEIIKLLADDLGNLSHKFPQANYPYYFVFKNYRKINNGTVVGIRLTREGCELLSRHYEKFTCLHNLPYVPGKLLVELERNLTWPYYLTDSTITFFNPADSAWFALYDSDLYRFIKDV